MAPPREGIIAALWTVTDAQGRVLEPELVSQLAFLRAAGVHGLMVLGSTGEFALLTPDQRRGFLEAVRELAADWPLIVNISDIRPEVVADLGRFACQLGCDSVSLLPPWFYSVAQEDLAEFFARGAEAAGLPLFLYNFPERTGNRIALATVATVAARVPLAGVKQSGAEFTYHRDLVELGREKGFVVLTGGEPTLAEAMALGVAGCVSGLANAVPEVVVALYGAIQRAEGDAARLAASRLRELCQHMMAVEFPLSVAAAMEARGRPVGSPKTLLSLATRARYEWLVADLRTLYRAWELP